MPFIGCRDGKRVIPADVRDGEKVSCVECGEELGVRGPFDDDTARHFFHLTQDARVSHCHETGSGGESVVHQQLKTEAVLALREKYKGQYSYCGPEVQLDVSETGTEEATRRADVYLRFKERNRFYGNGLIVEVQYKNHTKDTRSTTHDYLKSGFSVYWATISEFEGDEFSTEVMESDFQNSSPNAYAYYTSEAPSLGPPQSLPVEREETQQYSTVYPVPECDHTFLSGSSIGSDARYECISCGLELDYVFYDSEFDSLRKYTSDVVIEGNRFLAADLESIERPIEIDEVEEDENVPNHNHQWGLFTELAEVQKFVCRDCNCILVVGDSNPRIIYREPKPEWSPSEFVEEKWR